MSEHPLISPVAGLTADQAKYLRSQLGRLADAESLNAFQRDAYRHARTMLDELVAEGADR